MTNKSNDSSFFYNSLPQDSLDYGCSFELTADNLNFLDHHLPKNGRTLDLACGSGRLTLPLFHRGYLVEGIDISEKLISQARKNSKNQIDFRVGNMCALPYDNESFDAVFCMWYSFNHLLAYEDQILALKEAIRVLKMKGVVIFEVYSSAKNNKVDGAVFGKNKLLFQSYTQKSLRSLMNELGPSSYSAYSIVQVTMGGSKRLILTIRK